MTLPEYTALMQELERLLAAIERLVARARELFYELMLAGLTCPSCGGNLLMCREGRCRCTACGKRMDPTIQFQRCQACGGRLRLRVRRYACRRCGQDAPSRFLFDGKVFDADYFRRKMAESRERRRRERAEQREAASPPPRAPAVDPGAIDLGSSPGLVDLLNALVGGSAPDSALLEQAREAFDLKRYEQHVMAVLRAMPEGDRMTLQFFPPLKRPADRLERIRLFIAMIFLAHAQLIELRQQDQGQIWVTSRETQRQRHAIPSDAQDADGLA